MTEHLTRTSLVRAVLDAARQDPRIEGVLDYGSSSEGRADEWSDVDLALFVRDDALEGFDREWKDWAGQFGKLLLAYIGGIGHPWAVYDAAPHPLRADFAFHPASNADTILSWPNSPSSIESMLLHDATGGALGERVRRLVGQSLAPPDPQRVFDQACGDVWYYLLRTLVRLYRGHVWAALYEQNAIVLGNLFALMRIEQGATERLRGQSAAVGAERELRPERLARLGACVATPGEAGVRRAMLASAELAFDVSEGVAMAHSWPWPKELAGCVLLLLDERPPVSEE